MMRWAIVVILCTIGAISCLTEETETSCVTAGCDCIPGECAAGLSCVQGRCLETPDGGGACNDEASSWSTISGTTVPPSGGHVGRNADLTVSYGACTESLTSRPARAERAWIAPETGTYVFDSDLIVAVYEAIDACELERGEVVTCFGSNEVNGPVEASAGDAFVLDIIGDGDFTVQADACEASCSGKECGDDGCAGSCGTCADGESCQDGSCRLDCVPDCGAKECGDDGCGGSCGSCADSETCSNGVCCLPDCTGKDCGDDGCGGSCGSCADGESCESSGVCESPCTDRSDCLDTVTVTDFQTPSPCPDVQIGVRFRNRCDEPIDCGIEVFQYSVDNFKDQKYVQLDAGAGTLSSPTIWWCAEDSDMVLTSYKCSRPEEPSECHEPF